MPNCKAKYKQVGVLPDRETPIKIKKETYQSHRYRHDDNGNYERVPYQATRTTIQKGDND